MKPLRGRFAFEVTLALLIATTPARAQNVVESSDASLTVAPLAAGEVDLSELVWRFPLHAPPAAPSDEAVRVAVKLDRHVRDFLDAYPLRPFHNTLGISGREVYFDHPDEMYYALSLAAPYLERETAAHVRSFLARELESAPPYAVDGFDRSAGAARERYAVPEHLRARGRGVAPSAFGVFAFHAYVVHGGGEDSLAAHWPRVCERVEPLLAEPYAFDLHALHERDEAERFNGDLAGVIGAARLARLAEDSATEKRALERARQMLALRVNLERVNARILEPSKRSASNALHAFKLARYLDLAPATARALADHTGGVSATRLRAFREARNGWWIAFGPRLVGGENYTSPPHLSRALFDGAVFIERLPAEQVLSYVDIPWCRGDFYFISKCALALWLEAGGRWSEGR